MDAVGIIAEYNPFHTGHQYQISWVRQRLGHQVPIVIAMSGNWVQGGECAITDKWTRAQLALMGGADLILELPTPWAISSAEEFARGGVEVLQASGVVGFLCFGSEAGDIAGLSQVAHTLDTSEYTHALTQLLGSGRSFPACRQAAIQSILGPELAHLLSTPNNNLGIEYLRAIGRLNSAMVPLTLPRQGAAHNSISRQPAPFRSATQLRRHILAKEWDLVSPYLLPQELHLLQTTPITTIQARARMERLCLARLRTMSPEDWAQLPDSGTAEGLPQRLYQAGQCATSLEEFYALAKTKRYTHARLRRLALWACLGLTQAHRPDHIPYLRVLGFSPRGQALLSQMRTCATRPVLVKGAHARQLPSPGRTLFEAEVRCTDLYQLLLDDITPGGLEFRKSPVRWNPEQEEIP